MRITREKLTEFSNEYLRVLNNFSKLKEIARKMEKDFEKQENKAQVLETIVDTYNIDENKREDTENDSSQE